MDWAIGDRCSGEGPVWAVGGGEGWVIAGAMEEAVLVAESAFGGADPEGVLGYGEAADVVAGEGGFGGVIEGAESEAVEADEAAFGGDPEVSVWSLDDAVDAALGKAFFG
jgi:hypothetical protein